jgi:hypothetical protein
MTIRFMVVKLAGATPLKSRISKRRRRFSNGNSPVDRECVVELLGSNQQPRIAHAYVAAVDPDMIAQ